MTDDEKVQRRIAELLEKHGGREYLDTHPPADHICLAIADILDPLPDDLVRR